ncbi:MAG: hypothetical protein PHC34_04275 [Candidatus Gastranaerophilales bacterium]|nr:hypothetical protein [Candidatus Gastranaerophilales bacterium]
MTFATFEEFFSKIKSRMKNGKVYNLEFINPDNNNENFMISAWCSMKDYSDCKSHIVFYNQKNEKNKIKEETVSLDKLEQLFYKNGWSNFRLK